MRFESRGIVPSFLVDGGGSLVRSRKTVSQTELDAARESETGADHGAGDRKGITDIHVALVTPWQTKGGIAAYSDRLATALEAEGASVTPIDVAYPETASPRQFNRIVSDIPSDTDLVHVQFEAGVFGKMGMTGVCAPFFFERLRREDWPTITTLHEVHETHDHRNRLGDQLLRVRDAIIERAALRASDQVFVHSRRADEVLADRHGATDHCTHFHHPAEMDAEPVPGAEAKRRLGLSDAGPVYLTFGWVESKKRYRDVVSLLAEDPSATYLVAGEPRTDADREVLQRLFEDASQRGVREQVEYLGYVDENDVPAVFCAATAVVLPYERVSQSGVVNLALAYERPVVASALPVFEELEAEFGCLVTYETETELAATLDSVTNDDEVRARLVDNAADYTDRVTWERFATESVRTYERLVTDAAAD